MKKHFVLAVLAVSLTAAAQTPSIYNGLPSYGPKPKIHKSDKGPKPNSIVKDGAPARAQFVMTEHYPPALYLLVRSACGERPPRDEMISMAKGRKSRNLSARVVDWGEIGKGEKVQLWLVAATRVWNRRIDLESRDGKYKADGSSVREQFTWHYEPLISPTEFERCLQEENLDRTKVTRMVQNVLIRISGRNKSAAGR